jgi:predicted SprT family Zn-dependent metalloprotease
MKKQAPTFQPTEAQFKAFQAMYDYFNERLFEGKLPACLLNLSRANKAMGFFAPNRWKDAHEEEVAGQEIKMMHEISLNPDHLASGKMEAADTLVHEMAHLQRHITGKPPRGGYHDKQWAEMMLKVGLQPFNVKNPEIMTGQGVSDRPIPGGAFEKAWEEMPKEFLLPFVHIRMMDKEKKPKKQSKLKYTCPECEANVWGKPGLLILCGECNCKFKEEGQEDSEEEQEEE